MRRLASYCLGFLAAIGCVFSVGPRLGRSQASNALPPFRNPKLPLDDRLKDLISRMTLEEKVSQMMNAAVAIDRLGIPSYDWWSECLHGVARAGIATVFPQAIGLAATWDQDLLHEVASVISDEARAKHHEFARRGMRARYEGLTFWSPNINLFRDPRWGRGMETYGEDPYLTGRMAVQFIHGLQGDDPRYLKVVATAKHYAVHSGPESTRHTFDAQISERDLRESYLPHFEASIIEGHAFSVMCAYNRFEGDACCGSPLLLEKILREEWGFAGYVVSDCGAIDDIYRTHKIVPTAAEAAALSVKAGTDLECGSTFRSLNQAFSQGLITESEINTAVTRLFTARFKLGMFDPPDMVPFARIPYQVVDSKAHQDLAVKTARESMVLLKNDGNALPLRKDLSAIAVIGPNANDVAVLLGNYNGTPSHPITPLQGIRNKVSPKTRVTYALGCDWADNLPSFELIPSSVLFSSAGQDRQKGLKGEYFNNRDFKGAPVFTRIDPQIGFNWTDGTPDTRIRNDFNFSVRWTGELVAPATGVYSLAGYGMSAFRIYLEDKLLTRFESGHEPSNSSAQVTLQAGHAYPIRIEYYVMGGDAHMQLLWTTPGRDLEKAAMQAASQADAVVMVMGLSPRLEGEQMRVQVEGFSAGDRLDLKLPAVQEKLIQTIQKLGKPVVLVLLNGSALAVNWAADHVPAIVEAWYPGQAAGTALADILFGDADPGGRLPVTFYKSIDQLPPFDDYSMAGRTYRFFSGEPLFPFGFGLSYTRFKYSALALPKTITAGNELRASVIVQNTGNRVGDEVVQLYLSHVTASVPVPIRSLQGFRRISLRPGERRKVEFTLTPDQLSVLDKDLKHALEPGILEVAVGGKQPGFTGRADAPTTDVLTARIELRAK
jgi:beta-glucosidase